MNTKYLNIGLIPTAVAAFVLYILYFIYDFSLNSTTTFVIYTILSFFVFNLTLVAQSKIPSTRPVCITFLITYLVVYVFAYALGLNTSIKDYIKGFDFAVLSMSFLILTKSLINSIVNSKIRFVFNLIFLLLLFIGILFPSILICYLVATGSLISSDIIIALAQTNPSEGKEFFLSNVNIYWLIALLVLIFIYLSNLYAFSKIQKANFKYKKIIVLASIVSLGSVFLALPRLDYLPFSIVKVTSKQLDNFKVYKEQKALRLEKLKELDSLTLNSEAKANPSLYVLVIGESESKNHLNAYGYNRDTTPILNEHIKNGDAILFSHAFSSWPQTVQALTYALTQSNQYNSIESTNAFSLVEVARAAGFDTYWLSNQRKYGMYETPITVISSTANHEIWTNGSSKMEGVFFDEELVNQFPKIDENKNTLVIVHLMGSHQNYSKRVPSKYMIFKGDDSIIDEYDATVLYTDYIVDKIYKKVSQYKNFNSLVYFSDHGEDPHLVGGHDPVNVNTQMLQIPFVIYTSDNFKKEKSNLFKSIQNNKDKYWSNDTIFDCMISLLGIDGLPNYDETKSIFNDNYQINEDNLLTMYGKQKVNELKDYKK